MRCTFTSIVASSFAVIAPLMLRIVVPGRRCERSSASTRLSICGIGSPQASFAITSRRKFSEDRTISGRSRYRATET